MSCPSKLFFLLFATAVSLSNRTNASEPYSLTEAIENAEGLIKKDENKLNLKSIHRKITLGGISKAAYLNHKITNSHQDVPLDMSWALLSNYVYGEGRTIRLSRKDVETYFAPNIDQTLRLPCHLSSQGNHRENNLAQQMREQCTKGTVENPASFRVTNHRTISADMNNGALSLGHFSWNMNLRIVCSVFNNQIFYHAEGSARISDKWDFGTWNKNRSLTGNVQTLIGNTLSGESFNVESEPIAFKQQGSILLEPIKRKILPVGGTRSKGRVRYVNDSKASCLAQQHMPAELDASKSEHQSLTIEEIERSQNEWTGFAKEMGLIKIDVPKVEYVKEEQKNSHDN